MEKAQDEATVDISLSTVMTLGEAGPSSKAGQSSSAAAAKPSSAVAKGKARASQDDDDSDSEANSEVEEQEKALAQKGKGKGKGKANGVKAFEQRDLVALAFAGDNVVQDFAEAKQREIQADAPKEVDTTLPGWGSWGGIGTKKAPPKPHLVKKVAGIDPTTRADYKKAHVIISEKRDKKAAKYQVKDLPYPYTSKAQFERSMEMPLGTEWNTRLGFQRATLPKVVTKVRCALGIGWGVRGADGRSCRWALSLRRSKSRHEFWWFRNSFCSCHCMFSTHTTLHQRFAGSSQFSCRIHYREQPPCRMTSKLYTSTVHIRFALQAI
ncbi:Utp14-domain-containing protein [Trametes sanguinea]|nr:Utp14-domain-containing protein [Trametes sanguinea]